MPTKLSEELWDEIHEKLTDLISKHHRPASEVILDDVDLRNLLKISRRTSLVYRKKGVYKFYKIDGKIIYFLSDILDGIKKNGCQYEN